ncbi:PIN-like domain-containing protein, partial [Acinetobacter oleivorans]|uniref:PIN-like domain-containing protein n=1 Tax=Acinetobacter oleivorans TaxID=1148157 RepID=UPI001D17F418
MNDSFSCFYHLNETSELEKIWKDDNTIFIFDTNVLLSLYSFQPESRKDFIKVLDSISDRIWIPFHVGLEFQKNRLYVIKNRRNTFKELNDEIDKLIDTIKFDKKPFTTLQTNFSLKKNYPTVFTKLNKNLEKINDSFNVLEKELKESLKEIKDEVSNFDKDRIFVNSNDYIRDEIGNLFKGEKLGRNIYDDQEKLNQLYLVGNER